MDSKKTVTELEDDVIKNVSGGAEEDGQSYGKCPHCASFLKKAGNFYKCRECKGIFDKDGNEINP